VTELQQNRYDQLLRRVCDLKGQGSKVNDVLQELFPTLDVENVPGELLALMGTRIGWAGTSVVPTAGKKAGIQLFNPIDTGILVTISSVIVGSAGTSFIRWGLTKITLATNTGIPGFRDTRLSTSPSGVAQLRTSPDAVSLAAMALRQAANVMWELKDGNSFCVLAPGTGINFVGSADVELTVSFNYRERVAEPSELTF